MYNPQDEYFLITDRWTDGGTDRGTDRGTDGGMDGGMDRGLLRADLVVGMGGDSDDSGARQGGKLRVLELLRDRPGDHVAVGALSA